MLLRPDAKTTSLIQYAQSTEGFNNEQKTWELLGVSRMEYQERIQIYIGTLDACIREMKRIIPDNASDDHFTKVYGYEAQLEMMEEYRKRLSQGTVASTNWESIASSVNYYKEQVDFIRNNHHC